MRDISLESRVPGLHADTKQKANRRIKLSSFFRKKQTQKTFELKRKSRNRLQTRLRLGTRRTICRQIRLSQLLRPGAEEADQPDPDRLLPAVFGRCK